MTNYAGYGGPWIENKWIAHFTPERNVSEMMFRRAFGPFVPLFVRWVDTWKSDPRGYGDVVRYTCDLLSSCHLYVTISQHDDGITARKNSLPFSPCRDKNLLVLSAGGSGNVIIPLLKAPESLRRPLNPPVFQLVFAGSASRVRRPILKILRARMGQSFGCYKGEDFRSYWDKSRFVLTPRGYGKTAFMMYEALQMGYVPVYVWKDEEWIPYKGSATADLRKIGISINIRNLSTLPNILRSVTDKQLEERREAIRRVRESHFTYEGVMEQIKSFLHQPCQAELKVHSQLAVCHLPEQFEGRRR